MIRAEHLCLNEYGCLKVFVPEKSGNNVSTNLCCCFFGVLVRLTCNGFLFHLSLVFLFEKLRGLRSCFLPTRSYSIVRSDCKE